MCFYHSVVFRMEIHRTKKYKEGIKTTIFKTENRRRAAQTSRKLLWFMRGRGVSKKSQRMLESPRILRRGRQRTNTFL